MTTTIYDPGHDLHLMWEAFDRIREHGQLHHDDIAHPMHGFAALYRTMMAWERQLYLDMARKLEAADDAA